MAGNSASYDYQKVSVNSTMAQETMSKPKNELNEELVKRGALLEYKTSSCSVPP